MWGEGQQLPGVAIGVLVQSDLGVDHRGSHAQADHHALRPVALANVREGAINNQRIAVRDRGSPRPASSVPTIGRKAACDLQANVLGGSVRKLRVLSGLVFTFI